jgi:hypothetical protein
MTLLTHRPKHPTHSSTHFITLSLDILLLALVLGFLILASAAGLPANCGGVTRLNFNPDDAPNDPAPGYTTIRFGPGVAGQKGMLDKYCPLVEATFWLEIIVLALMITSAMAKALLVLMAKYRLVPIGLEDALPNEEPKRVSVEGQSAMTTVSISPSAETTTTTTLAPPEQVTVEPVKHVTVTEESNGGHVCDGFQPRQLELGVEDKKEPPPYVRKG